MCFPPSAFIFQVSFSAVAFRASKGILWLGNWILGMCCQVLILGRQNVATETKTWDKLLVLIVGDPALPDGVSLQRYTLV